MAARLSTKADYEGLLNSYDTWLFDCDGVLWEGTRLIPGAKEVLAFLRKSGECTIFSITFDFPHRYERREGRCIRHEQCNTIA